MNSLFDNEEREGRRVPIGSCLEEMSYPDLVLRYGIAKEQAISTDQQGKALCRRLSFAVCFS